MSSRLSPLFHPRLDLDLLVPGEHDPDVDISRVGLLLPQEVIDPGLDVRAQPGDLEFLRSELVIFLGCSRCLVTSVTFKSKDININRSYVIDFSNLRSGNLVHMKNTNLMKSPSAVLAINIRFRIKSIIFSRLKLFFWNLPTGLITFIIGIQNWQKTCTYV